MNCPVDISETKGDVRCVFVDEWLVRWVGDIDGRMWLQFSITTLKVMEDYSHLLCQAHLKKHPYSETLRSPVLYHTS